VTLPDGREVPVAGSLSEFEVLWSSTAREVIGFLRLLEATAQLFLRQIRNSTVQLIGDNQAAVLAINQFRSKTTDVTESLKSIFKLCGHQDSASQLFENQGICSKRRTS
jgi:hypothetical protein